MKKRIRFLFLLLAVYVSSPLYAQTEMDSSDFSNEDILKTDLKERLPPLDNLINIALKNSPTLKIDAADKDRNEDLVLLAKRQWQDNIGGFLYYGKGNMGLVTADGGGGGSSFLNGYRAGLNIFLPLSMFTTRAAQIRVARAEYRAAGFKMEQSELELKNKVVEDYYTLIGAFNTLKITSLAKENAHLLGQMAEKRFSEGTISLEEYTNVGRTVSGAETDFELAKSNYLTQYKQFEQLLGVSLENLRARK